MRPESWVLSSRENRATGGSPDLATVPGERATELPGQGRDPLGEGIPDRGGGTTGGQGRKEEIAGPALDEGGDRRAAAGSDEEIAFPVPGDRPVLDLGRPLAGRVTGGVAVGRATMMWATPPTLGRGSPAVCWRGPPNQRRHHAKARQGLG